MKLGVNNNIIAELKRSIDLYPTLDRYFLDTKEDDDASCLLPALEIQHGADHCVRTSSTRGKKIALVLDFFVVVFLGATYMRGLR